MLVRLFVFLFVSVLSPFLWVSTPITPIKSIFAPSSIPSMQITVHRLNCSHQTFISQEQETFLSLSFASLQYGITFNHTWLLRTNISKQMKTSGQLFFFNKYLYFFRFSVFKKIDWKASEIFSYFEHQMVTLLLWSGLMDVEFCSSSVLLLLMRASLCRVYLSRMIFVYFWRCSEVNFFPCWICGIWAVLFFFCCCFLFEMEVHLVPSTGTALPATTSTATTALPSASTATAAALPATTTASAGAAWWPNWT